MRISLIYIFLLAAILTSCQNTTDISYPELSQDSQLIGVKKLSRTIAKSIEGVFNISDGADILGEKGVVKSSPNGISIYLGKNISFIVMKAGIVAGDIVLEGYWRDLFNSKTGVAKFKISADSGAKELIAGTKPAKLIMAGYVIREVKNIRNITMTYANALSSDELFYVIAHRGGGRNSDNLPASENSVELIRMASDFGANAIEIDVRLTKDNIPILFHDDFVSNRLVNGDLLVGPIENYYYSHILSFCTLKQGEKVPTLEAALDAAIYDSDVKLVWLDLKSAYAIPAVTSVIDKAKEKAKQANRKIEFVLGLCDTDRLNEYMNFSAKKDYPALCELSTDEAINSGASYWGPPWTLGSQLDKVQYMHSKSKKVFIWTIDDSKFIKKFLQESDFDGFVTNYPSIVAYEFYVK